MTGARIHIDVNSEQVAGGLADLAGRMVNLRPVFREISGVLADDVEQAFEDERNPSTLTPWEALAESSIRQRSEEGTWPGEILQRFGRLAASVSTSHGDDFAEIGSNKVYAAIQQLGGQAGRNRTVKIPARPFLGLSADGADEILEICQRYLAGAS